MRPYAICVPLAPPNQRAIPDKMAAMVAAIAATRSGVIKTSAYEAAERLKQAHDAGAQIHAPGNELADTAETARRDLIASSTPEAWQPWSATPTELPRTLVSTSQLKRSEDLLILKRKNENGVRTSLPRRSPLVWQDAPCGWPSDKAS